MAAFLATALVALAATACFQQSSTYPVEVLKEMHYSQASRPQEPPRLAPVRGAQAFAAVGADAVLELKAENRRAAYDPVRAAELYRVNCSVCHGIEGAGDGRAAVHLTSKTSYAATKPNGAPYAAPPNLQASLDRPEFTRELAFATVNNGVVVMPRFGALLPEEDIREIVDYIFDAQAGIASKKR